MTAEWSIGPAFSASHPSCAFVSGRDETPSLLYFTVFSSTDLSQMKLLYAEWFGFDVGFHCPTWNSFDNNLSTSLEFFSSADGWQNGQLLDYGCISAKWFAYGIIKLPPGTHQYKLRWTVHLVSHAYSPDNDWCLQREWFNDSSLRPIVDEHRNQLMEVPLKPLTKEQFYRHVQTIPMVFDAMAYDYFSVNSLASIILNQDAEETEEVEECPICLGDMTVQDKTESCAVGHRFHHDCLSSWGELSASCPVCRCELFTTWPKVRYQSPWLGHNSDYDFDDEYEFFYD